MSKPSVVRVWGAYIGTFDLAGSKITTGIGGTGTGWFMTPDGYIATNAHVVADIKNGDTLVTSGIDGTYPPGLPVATVARIERDAAYAFARITLAPTAGTDRYRQVLVLSNEANAPPPEMEHPVQKPPKPKRQRKAG